MPILSSFGGGSSRGFRGFGGSSLFSFTSHTFTTSTGDGASGAPLSNFINSYSNTSWASNSSYFNVVNGIQLWTVPTTGTYRIVARGANGKPATGNASTVSGGRGVIITADVTLNKSEVIKILVGQQGLASTNNGGGGGGTFIVRSPYNTESSIVVIAGGGGGRRIASLGVGIDGSNSTSGWRTQFANDSSSNNVFINTNNNLSEFPNTVILGYGGSAGTNGFGDGGAGFFGDGFDDSTVSTAVAKAFINGGNGGVTPDGSHGGFGGGGSGQGGNGGGGGGGYTGGNGGHTAGGGGSFVISSATNVSYTYDTNYTYPTSGVFHGYVTITKL